MSKNVAVILAGGSGQRMGFDMPKQFIKVAGKAVLEHTVQVFQDCGWIDEIAIVSNPSFIHLVEKYVVNNSWSKVKKILNGGEERYDSSLSAINAYEDPDVKLIFHDAVRPLVSETTITSLIKALDTYDAVDTAIPAADTIIQVAEDKDMITNIPNRNVLRRGQTPQGFRLGTIRKAYHEALKDPEFRSTDDCGVVVKYLPDTAVFVVNGEESNIKLTYKEDIYLLDKLFQLKTIHITSNPELSKLKNKVVVVFGGRLGIGAEIVRLCRLNGIQVFPFSRTLNGVDVVDPSRIKNALMEVFSETGRIDCVINTAGILSKEPLASMTYASINESLDINLKGVINVALESFPFLKKSGGHLLFYTSSSYTRGRAYYSLYSATKAAIVNFVQAVADEWDSFRVHVNCVNPERTKTPMRISNFGTEPEHTLLNPEEVAMVSLGILASDLNGQVVDVKLQY